jgi:RNA polymerase sigma-70 factor, ECF subfamily
VDGRRRPTFAAPQYSPLQLVKMSSVPSIPSAQDTSDEELVRQLAAGREEALGTLYSRHAPWILNLAAQSLDRSAAEEIVQDVLLSVWRHATVFTPERGTFRAWVMQMARYRILNELRRRSRRPQLGPDPDGLLLASLPDNGPGPAEAVWRKALRSTVRSAIQELPSSQRQALDLALFKDLTHEQAATELGIPLGTAKTRIRSGLQRLRGRLAAVMPEDSAGRVSAHLTAARLRRARMSCPPTMGRADLTGRNQFATRGKGTGSPP